MADNGQKTIEELSKQFLDLWQRQMTVTMKNPETVGSMMEMLHTMQSNMGTFYGTAKTATANTDISEPGNDELRKLNSRISELEKRLDKLESGAKGKGTHTRK